MGAFRDAVQIEKGISYTSKWHEGMDDRDYQVDENDDIVLIGDLSAGHWSTGGPVSVPDFLEPLAEQKYELEESGYLKPVSRLKVEQDYDGPLLFQVRDACTVLGWHEKGETETEGRLLTIVGWVVSDDGVFTHIAAQYDNVNETYGDGIAVPNSCIVEVQRLVVR